MLSKREALAGGDVQQKGEWVKCNDVHVVQVRPGLFQWVGRRGGRILVHELLVSFAE